MALLTYELVRIHLTAHAWRAMAPEWREGFLEGLRTATKDRAPNVRLVSSDGVTLEERS
jgi:hypothetical protein